MAMLTLTFDRPHQAMTGAHTRHLRVGIAPSGRLATRPADVLLLLDASSSMRATGLFEPAKAACCQLAAILRPQDRLSVALFDGMLRPIVRGMTGTDMGRRLADTLADYATGYGTRLDLGLDWLRLNAAPEAGRHRLAVLVTDGHPTDSERQLLRSFDGLERKADVLARAGLKLTTIGLGASRMYNVPLLSDLARRTGGDFLLAPTVTELAPRLRDLLAPAQDVVDERATLTITPLEGLCPDRAWRVTPRLGPLHPSTAGKEWTLELGEIEAQVRTDILLRCMVQGPGDSARQGERTVAHIRVSVGGAELVAEASLDFSRDKAALLLSDRSVERDIDLVLFEEKAQRLRLDISQDPGRTRSLGAVRGELDEMAAIAGRLGAPDLVAIVALLREEAVRSGALADHALSGLLSSTTGRLRGLGKGTRA